MFPIWSGLPGLSPVPWERSSWLQLWHCDASSQLHTSWGISRWAAWMLLGCCSFCTPPVSFPIGRLRLSITCMFPVHFSMTQTWGCSLLASLARLRAAVCHGGDLLIGWRDSLSAWGVKLKALVPVHCRISSIFFHSLLICKPGLLIQITCFARLYPPVDVVCFSSIIPRFSRMNLPLLRSVSVISCRHTPAFCNSVSKNLSHSVDGPIHIYIRKTFRKPQLFVP